MQGARGRPAQRQPSCATQRSLVFISREVLKGGRCAKQGDDTVSLTFLGGILGCQWESQSSEGPNQNQEKR